MKNKVAAPFKQAEFQIMYGEGINTFGELVDLGVKHKLVEKPVRGTATTAIKSAGKANATNFLKENPAIANELDVKLRDMLLTGATAEAATADSAADKYEEASETNEDF